MIPLIAISLLQVAPDQPRFPPKGSPEQRANYERGQARQFRFEQRNFIKAGLAPLEALRSQNRSVKRAFFVDAYGLFSIPALEIERLKHGRVVIRIVKRSGASTEANLRTSDWDLLTRLQGSLFRLKPYVAWDPSEDLPGPIGPPPPVCHGWYARFGLADETGLGSGGWSQCGDGRNSPEYAFMSEMARLAVSNQKQCRFDPAHAAESFSGCFREG